MNNLRTFCAAAAAVGTMALANPAHAVVTTFSTVLSNIGEPVPTSTATGAAVVSFDNVANTVTVLLSFAGLANASPFGHIHCCTAVAGTGSSGVALNFNTTFGGSAFPAASTGSYISVFTLPSASFNSLLTGVSLGQAYVNIHTPGTYGAGEIRGFLPALVPEPSTYGLMFSGLAAVGLLARRRKMV
jgi:CHRD domain/PEP-CTERM motif